MNNPTDNETREVERAAARKQSGCCGGAAPDGVACCALDAQMKSAGRSGCGCAAKAAAKKGCC